MVRGTTAQFKFKLPYPVDELGWVTIKFWQSNNPNPYLPIVRRLEHRSASDAANEFCVSLTTEETLRFLDKYKAQVQLRAFHTSSGTVFGSLPQLITVYPMKDEILEDYPTIPAPNEDNWIVLDGKPVT